MADSDESALSVLAMVLRSKGYIVFTASNAPQGIATFRNYPIDLVIGNDNLGQQLIRELKKISSYIPMMILCQPGTISFSAADCIIEKHCKPDALYARIRVMIARKRGPRPGSSHAEAP